MRMADEGFALALFSGSAEEQDAAADHQHDGDRKCRPGYTSEGKAHRGQPTVQAEGLPALSLQLILASSYGFARAGKEL